MQRRSYGTKQTHSEVRKFTELKGEPNEAKHAYYYVSLALTIKSQPFNHTILYVFGIILFR
jgi:hypothetical protein